MNSKTDLYFFTAEFPFSTGETFIENELEYLSASFDQVIIFPYKSEGARRPLPVNFTIGPGFQNSAIDGKDWLLIIKILLFEFFRIKNNKGKIAWSKRFFFLRKIKTKTVLLKNAVRHSKNIEDFIKKRNTPDFCCYSYWMNEWALVLAILKSRKKIKSFVFRCGGYDIWDERHEGNYLPFRFYIYSQTDGIYPNSKKGELYLKGYNWFPEKAECLYWGTKDKGLNPFKKNELPCIVSCSSLIPLKRVGKIIEVLKHMDIPLKWVHFGDGPLKAELMEQIKKLPSNIVTELKGNIKNELILEYYSQNSVTCFINASSTESLPVSIQEAISFGIPVIGTDVGGVKEIVNENTGELLPVNFNEKETAERIKQLMIDQFSDEAFRKGVREFWKKSFSAENNYTQFVKKIIDISVRKR